MPAKLALLIVLIAACAAAGAQGGGGTPAGKEADAVQITGIRNPVDKSYRKMVRGMELFEKKHQLAPNATLRFKLLPRKPNSNLEDIGLEIAGDSFTIPVDIAPDRTFTLERDRKALAEDASVRSNRRHLTMTWRADIRTPGLPPDTRRLGDLRLECAVGKEAELISNANISPLARLLFEPPDYCNSRDNRYLFFAERPVFGVELVSGGRREAIPADRLWGGASYDPDWKSDLPYCDCEVLMDRAYFLPLDDRSWPDDTLVVFQYMEAATAVQAGNANVQ